MPRPHVLSNVLLAAMVLVPTAYLVQNIGHASVSAPSILNSSLMLNRLPAIPQFDQLNRLDYPVLSNYTIQKGEDLWFFCKRNQLNLDAIRACSDLDVLTNLQGTTLK